MREVGSSCSQDPALSSFFLSFSLTAFLRLPILSLNNIPVSGLQLDHRDSGSPLASGVADKKDKEQMVVFVIPSPFQPPGKPHHLSLSLHHSSIAAIWMGPNLRNASSLVGTDLRNQMVRLFGAINSLRESVGTCLQQRFGARGWMCWMTFFLKVPPREKKKSLEGVGRWGPGVGGSRKNRVKGRVFIQARKAHVKYEAEYGNFS